MKVKCHCGMVYQVTAAVAGRRVKCKKCSRSFTVPGTRSGESPKKRTTAQGPASRALAQGVTPKKKTPAQLKAEREEAVLKKYIDPNKKTLEEQIVERRHDRIEKLRVTNSAQYIVIGVVLAALGIGAFMLFAYLGRNGGVVPRVVAAVYYTGGQWWLPILFLLAAAYHFFIGIGSLMRIVNIDDEEGLPEHFG